MTAEQISQALPPARVGKRRNVIGCGRNPAVIRVAAERAGTSTDLGGLGLHLRDQFVHLVQHGLHGFAPGQVNTGLL